MNPPTIYILGAGAIGLTFGYFLQQAGFPITFILRDDETLSLFKAKQGFDYQIEEQCHFISCQALLAQHLIQSLDVLIVCTKAFDVLNALNSVNHALSNKTKILISHNGLGIAEQIQNNYPHFSMRYAITTIGAYRKNPFDVVMRGKGKIILDSDLFAEFLSATNLDIAIETDFKKISWHKFIVNCAINALTAIYRCNNGELLQSEHIRQLMKEIIQEINHLAIHEQLAFDLNDLYQDVFRVAQQTAHNYSSMLQDVIHQKRTEIDYLNGHVVSLAAKHHKNAPYNLIISNIIKRLHHDYA